MSRHQHISYYLNHQWSVYDLDDAVEIYRDLRHASRFEDAAALYAHMETLDLGFEAHYRELLEVLSDFDISSDEEDAPHLEEDVIRYKQERKAKGHPPTGANNRLLEFDTQEDFDAWYGDDPPSTGWIKHYEVDPPAVLDRSDESMEVAQEVEPPAEPQHPPLGEIPPTEEELGAVGMDFRPTTPDYSPPQSPPRSVKRKNSDEDNTNAPLVKRSHLDFAFDDILVSMEDYHDTQLGYDDQGIWIRQQSSTNYVVAQSTVDERKFSETLAPTGATLLPSRSVEQLRPGNYIPVPVQDTRAQLQFASMRCVAFYGSNRVFVGPGDATVRAEFRQFSRVLRRTRGLEDLGGPSSDPLGVDCT